MGLIVINHPKLYYRKKELGQVQSFSASSTCDDDMYKGECFEFEVLTNKPSVIKQLYRLFSKDTKTTLEIKHREGKCKITGKVNLIRFEENYGNFKNFTFKIDNYEKRNNRSK